MVLLMHWFKIRLAPSISTLNIPTLSEIRIASCYLSRRYEKRELLGINVGKCNKFVKVRVFTYPKDVH